MGLTFPRLISAIANPYAISETSLGDKARFVLPASRVGSSGRKLKIAQKKGDMPINGELSSGRAGVVKTPTRKQKTRAFRNGSRAFKTGAEYEYLPQKFKLCRILSGQWQWGWRSAKGATGKF